MNKGKIETNPNILTGKPVIKGTRIPVYLILNLFANGCDKEKIIEDYPQLTEEDVKAALEYAQNITARDEEKKLHRVTRG